MAPLPEPLQSSRVGQDPSSIWKDKMLGSSGSPSRRFGSGAQTFSTGRVTVQRDPEEADL